MLTVLAAIADAAAWADRNAYAVAWVALAAGVTVLVARALPRPEPDQPETAPDAEADAEADFDTHPDAAELEALFAAVLTEPQPPPDTDPRPHLP